MNISNYKINMQMFDILRIMDWRVFFRAINFKEEILEAYAKTFEENRYSCAGFIPAMSMLLYYYYQYANATV